MNEAEENDSFISSSQEYIESQSFLGKITKIHICVDSGRKVFLRTIIVRFQLTLDFHHALMSVLSID
jgi:hypothetical protein